MSAFDAKLPLARIIRKVGRSRGALSSTKLMYAKVSESGVAYQFRWLRDQFMLPPVLESSLGKLPETIAVSFHAATPVALASERGGTMRNP